MSEPSVEISHGIATITLNRPASLNALTAEDYTFLPNTLRELDRRDDVVVTVWQATGKFFCAGTDVKNSSARGEHEPTARHYFVEGVSRTNTDLGHALSSHSKILVAYLNGPVMGIMAAFLGHFDFIYSLPNAWLSVPFTFLGIISEGGSSVSFINRMGVAKANEVLIWGKKKEAQELLECGFINKIFPSQPIKDFHAAARSHLLSELEGLDPEAVLIVKKLLRAGLREKNDPDAANLRESMEQAGRFATGKPAEQFMMIANKQIRHKL